ncbi:MAG: monooxygenase [Dehalococcoidia bacterium]
MSYMLTVDFPYQGPWGNAMSSAMKRLAQSIANEPGLMWKVWVENEERREAGGVYLFSDRPSAEAYWDMHSKRLAGFGVTECRARIFAVNEALSRMCRAPIGEP